MTAHHLGDVVHDIFHRNVGIDRRRERVYVVHSAEVDEGLGLKTSEIKKFAAVAEPEIVDQSRAEGCRITDGETLIVIVFDLTLG